MKKYLLAAALLLLLLLPACALGETWAEFVRLAEEAMTGQAGEVTLQAPALVTADPEAEAAVPLVVPDGVRLAIKGGTFETMVLGGGDLTLSGVTVAGLPDADAILMPPQGKAGRLKLTIDEGSTIAASGSGRALSCTHWNLPGSLEIENQGQITAENGACADLRLTPEGGDAVLRFQNSGSIRGGNQGVTLWAQPQKGVASVGLTNAGLLSAAGESATLLVARSEKRGAYATLENRVGATIEQTGAEGSAVILEVSDSAPGSAVGQGLILNQGILRAGSEPIRLHAKDDPAVPVRIQQEGLVEENSGKIAPAAYVYLAQTDAGKLKDGELEGLAHTWARDWAEALNLGAMPTGTRMELVVLDEDGEERGRLTARSEGREAERPTLSWKEFRAQAQAQIDIAPAGEVRVYVRASVGSPQGKDSGRDKGLDIPAGKTLTLVDGDFAHILLANGSLRLSGSRAGCISIPAGENEIAVDIEIDPDSSVAATGEGWAIYTEGIYKKACAIRIQNQGRVESGAGGIDLTAAVVGDREVALEVSNTGKILTRGQSLRMTATTQSAGAHLTLQNDGVIESTGQNAVTLTGLSSKQSCWFRVENGAEGNIHCSTGSALVIKTLDPTAQAVNPRERVPGLEEAWGGVVIENQGKIGGKEAPIQVESLLRALFPVTIALDGEGTVTVKEGEAEVLLTALYHAEKESRVLPEAEFDEVVRGHAGESITLPEGLRARVRMRVPVTAEIPEELVLYEGEL